MRRPWIGSGVIGLALAASVAAAQSVPPPGASAFDQLSPGNQKIARALFQAQQAPPGAVPVTRDDIAAMKLNGGSGWGEIFQRLKAQGYFQQKNLGLVVSRSSHQLPAPAAAADTTITTASGKAHAMGGPESAAGSATSASGAKGGHAGSSGTSASSASGTAYRHGQNGGGHGSYGHGAPRGK